jgi:hypothetical protein
MQDHSDGSSKTIQSDSFLVATTRVDSTENTESSTSNVSYCFTPVIIPTCDASESNASIRPKKTAIVFPRTMTVTFNGLLRFFHIENFENASDEESTFLRLLQFNLQANIKKLAQAANGDADRAAQAVLSAMTSMFEEV